MTALTTKLLPMSTDDRGSWRLSDASPLPLIKPGQSVQVECALQSWPLVFTGLRVGLDGRFQKLGPEGITGATTAGLWRVDEVTIDGVVVASVVAALEAEALVCADRRVVEVHGAFGVGSRVRIRATNVGDTDAYFYATWELEDAH